MLELFLYTTYATFGGLGFVALRQIRFAAIHFNPPQQQTRRSDDLLPTVTVCIPARNEDHAMADCLQRVLASTYPKLEIIVLDDASVDNTSALIKSFAHEGVRFVEGATLPAGWLGKNHALEELREEASGDFILFLDVDTRITPRAIEHLVNYMLDEGVTMTSVLSRREDGWRGSVVFSPLRYFWEVLFHRNQTPAVSGSAWLVDRADLAAYGGFSSLRDAVKPESALANHFAQDGQYRFLVSTKAFGFGLEKKWRSQLLTSVRLLRPALSGSWLRLFVVLFDLALLLVPVAIAAGAFNLGLIHQIIAGVLVVLQMAVYGSYTHRVWARGSLIGALLWPVLVAQEMILMVASFVLYARGKVTWKGRPIRSEAQS